MDKKELIRRLNNVNCPFAYHPDMLDRDNFKSSFKTRIISTIFPTLKEEINNGKRLFAINTKSKDETVYYKGFGYLYTYCVANELSTKKIPVFITREHLQEAIKANDYKDLETTDSILFISNVASDCGFYSNEELRLFSNFLYNRILGGKITILDCDSLVSTGFLTGFMLRYLYNTAYVLCLSED